MKKLYSHVLAFGLASGLLPQGTANDAAAQKQAEPSCNVVQPDPGKENTWFCLSCDEDKRGIVAVFNSTQMDYLMIGRLAAHPESGETVFMAEREARANFLEEPTKQAMKAYCETGLEPNPNFIIDVNALRPEAERF